MLGQVVGEDISKESTAQGDAGQDDRLHSHEQKKLCAARNWLAFCGVDLDSQETSVQQESHYLISVTN